MTLERFPEVVKPQPRRVAKALQTLRCFVCERRMAAPTHSRAARNARTWRTVRDVSVSMGSHPLPSGARQPGAGKPHGPA